MPPPAPHPPRVLQQIRGPFVTRGLTLLITAPSHLPPIALLIATATIQGIPWQLTKIVRYPQTVRRGASLFLRSLVRPQPTLTFPEPSPASPVLLPASRSLHCRKGLEESLTHMFTMGQYFMCLTARQLEPPVVPAWVAFC